MRYVIVSYGVVWNYVTSYGICYDTVWYSMVGNCMT